MVNNEYNDSITSESLLGMKPIKAYPIIGFLFGFIVFTLFSWFIDLNIQGYKITPSGLAEMHINNPIHFLIDSAPFILSILAYFIAKRDEGFRYRYTEELGQLNEIIAVNTKFAQRIGDPEFELNNSSINTKDRLGQTLVSLHNSLIQTDTKEKEQNWIAKGRDLISGVLRRHNNIEMLSYETLYNIIKYTGLVQGAFYLFNEETKTLENIATHAYNRKKFVHKSFKIGEGLVGQTAYEMDYIYRTEIPKEFITITSGLLGDKKPASILLVPLIGDEKLQGVIELAALETEISELVIRFVKELSEIIGQTVFNLKVNVRTERLLSESQIQTTELKENDEELRKNAIQMKSTQDELERSNVNLEAQVDEVEKAQKRLFSLLENASEVISIFDETGVITYESPSVKRIIGYTPEEVVGKNAFKQAHTPAAVGFKDIFNELIINPELSQTTEFEFTRRDGSFVWLETTGRNFLNNPAIKGIIFNTRDITVRKVAEEAEKKSGQMQALSENSPDMILRINVEGVFFYANPMAEKYIGISSKKLLNSTIESIELEPKVVEILEKVIEEVRDSFEKIEFESDMPTAEGERIVQVNGIPEFDDHNNLITILLIIYDTTERKRIEREIQQKNKNISDSINYAQRIQTAILPDNNLIREYLPKSFIFYKPRDVVSGDFPWFFSRGNNLYIAAVDCTGHGVPGAMLAFVAYFLLNNIVDHDVELTAAEVLDKLHEQVRKTLRQDRNDASARDGMDIAFCRIDRTNKELHYAGAHRPLYHLREGNIEEYKGNKKAIGGIPHRKKKEKDFVNHVIKYNLGDKVFFFSDGLPDQIGGPTGRKYQASRIKNAVTEHSHYSMNQFFRHFSRDFNQWKGDKKQIDDVIMIGIEF